MTTQTRFPFNTFAIGFGLAGLGQAWQTAADSLRLPALVGYALWLPAVVAWVWLMIAHLARGARSATSLRAQLRDPIQGPVAALVPLTGMLIGGELAHVSTAAGVALFLISLAEATALAASLLAAWIGGGLDRELIHGGHLLPTGAVGLVGAGVAARSGIALLGWALFAAGCVFWAVMTLLVLERLAFRSALPDPLVPTLAVLIAPAAVAGSAWFALDGAHPSPGAGVLLGIGALLVIVQLTFVPRYRRLAFSLGFWSFTFPGAAVAVDAMLSTRIVTFPAGRP